MGKTERGVNRARTRKRRETWAAERQRGAQSKETGTRVGEDQAMEGGSCPRKSNRKFNRRGMSLKQKPKKWEREGPRGKESLKGKEVMDVKEKTLHSIRREA